MSGGGGQCSAEKTGWARCSSQAGEEPLQGQCALRALVPGPRGAGTQPSAWVSSEHKEGRRCQHPWGLAAAKVNSGGGVEDTAWEGRGKMGQQPRSPPGASRAGAEAPPDEGQRGQRRPRLKAQRSENKDPGIRSHHFMANRWGNRGNGGRL